jgi:hypothetical protein
MPMPGPQPRACAGADTVVAPTAATVAKTASAFLMRSTSVECLSRQRVRFLLVAAGDRFRRKIMMRFRRASDSGWTITSLRSGRIEPFADRRDIWALGHFDFQFYDNAAGHYFSPAALLVLQRFRIASAIQVDCAADRQGDESGLNPSVRIAA